MDTLLVTRPQAAEATDFPIEALTLLACLDEAQLSWAPRRWDELRALGELAESLQRWKSGHRPAKPSLAAQLQRAMAELQWRLPGPNPRARQALLSLSSALMAGGAALLRRLDQPPAAARRPVTARPDAGRRLRTRAPRAPRWKALVSRWLPWVDPGSSARSLWALGLICLESLRQAHVTAR
ncbi:MAG: hypothetical protein VKP62_09590 [Candidatus Sericytochromatia bacterium]|nr:hypothetical protein [Candidatus Sericytochromatia bacterium]